MGLEKKSLRPLMLVPVLVGLDQLLKFFVERKMAPGAIIEVWGDFLWLWHVRNTAMAFSLGDRLPPALKTVVFVVLPVLVLAGITVYYLRTSELSTFQRWCFAVILGGGVGNLIDRVARGDGVVDFVSVKFYGLFGLERWPTFNLADASIVVGGILLLATYVLDEIRGKR